MESYMETPMIKLSPQMSPDEQKNAVETAAILGFYSEKAVFPVAGTQGSLEVPKDLALLKEMLPDGIIPHMEKTRPENYISATDHARPVPDMDVRRKKGLEQLFSKGCFLEDQNHDLLPDCFNFHIVLPQPCGLSSLTAACNLAFRFGMETTEFQGPVTGDRDLGGNLLIIEEGASCCIRLEQKEDEKHVILTGQGRPLEEFTAWLCNYFPLLPEGRTWTDELITLSDTFAMKNLDGQLIRLRELENSGVKADTAYVSSEIGLFSGRAAQEFPGIRFVNHKGMKKVWEKSFDVPWEADVFQQKFKELISKKVRPGDTVSVLGAVSEDGDVRRQIAKSIEQELEKQGAAAGDIDILCSYKQGYSWIEDIVLPRMKSEGRPARIDIAFRPFLPEGTTKWLDEDGATPSYNNLDADNPNRWYDLPIRYLQELYPAEDLIADTLSIDREDIHFSVYDGEEDLTYRFRASDAEGGDILCMDYRACRAERPYMDDYPGMGKVHPATGYLKVMVNGTPLHAEIIQTDVEAVWDLYQKEVLPWCRRFIDDKTGDALTAAMQPFFSRLVLDVQLSEPDVRLHSREDLISSLDALHEDLYFVGSDYFKNYGIKKSGVMLDAPGLILPVIKKKYGKPYFKAVLYDQEAKAPCIKSGDEILALESPAPEIFIREIRYMDGMPDIHLQTEGCTVSAAESFAYLAGRDMLETTERMGVYGTLTLHAEGKTASLKLTAAKTPEKDLDIRDIDLMEHALIGYEEYQNIIEQLKRVPGICVYRIARSYMGRDIYAVELLNSYEGYVSRTKRITNHPSQIINSRHHANEVSSTNSAFMLIRGLLTDPAYADLAEQMNLVIVPMENVDGAAIHYELQKDNPYWKLHMARFNAIGKEFYHEHFNPRTIHTEAMGLTRLWERFLPDIIVDNHGVPSHEWEQQFSGYTSPSFKGFWLPRSLLYGYFWTVTDAEYKENYLLNKKLEDVIADAIGADPQMKHLNQEWMGRFEKYAHGFMPKLFPADYYKEMINYWIPFSYDPGHRYPSIRFPWITSCCYTSEVADETAQGDYLNLCARAHLTHDLATIKMMRNCTCVYDSVFTLTGKEVVLRHTRQRPVCV